MRKTHGDRRFSRNSQGGTFTQNLAVLSLLVLAAFAVIGLLGGAVNAKYLCAAAAVVGAAGENCGGDQALPAQPQAPVVAAQKTAEPPLNVATPNQPKLANLTIDNPPAPPLANHEDDEKCGLTPEQEALLVEAASVDYHLAQQYNQSKFQIQASCLPGQGSDAHVYETPTEIHIDVAKFDSKAELIITLSHELDHSEYTGVIPDFKKPEVTCEAFTEGMLNNEANSTLGEFMLLYRLYANGSPDFDAVDAYLRIKHPVYYDTYRAWLDELLANYSPEAELATIEKIGDVFGGYEPSGTPDGTTYTSYYMDSCLAAKAEIANAPAQ